MERQFNACQTHRSNSFRVIRCLSQCVSPKIAIFTTFWFSPGDAPGAITLNVVWMEREFDAYKLSRCMFPSDCNSFWDTARYWSKIVNFFIPPCIRRPRYGGSRWNSATPLRMEKLEWLSYHVVKKFRRYLYSFWRNSRTSQTDGRTSGDSIYRAYAYASRGKNDTFVQLSLSLHFHLLYLLLNSSSSFRDIRAPPSGKFSSTLPHCVFNFNVPALVVY